MNIDVFFDAAMFATTFTTLIVILDPPGTIPVFLGLTARLNRAEQRRAALQATAVSISVILIFAVLGQQILHLLQISMEALQLSGGVLLFLVAMELLMGQDSGEPDTGDARVNVALVPLGTPLLAGPGSIVAVMVSVAQARSSLAGWVAVIVAVVIAHIVMWAAMRFSLELSRFLGPGGIMLLTKISGLLLAAIATQLVMTAVFIFIKSAHF
ncbi:MarC family protein [Schaalia sp. ZJ405]|uniref:MarC family protein n=1 Tax=unclassified Schaalia TaxID=2691889 RepID=UPI0013EA78D6|nr:MULTISPECIES: MarC family protein [unclassified Schaalia]QPK81673.1 MarC family protein [Schaalia sp. ZJ405]